MLDIIVSLLSRDFYNYFPISHKWYFIILSSRGPRTRDPPPQLLNNPEFADVTFVVQGKQIYAHRAVLVAQCPHFKALFSAGMKESIEKEIVIEGWGETAFLALLEWIYTGRVPQDLPVHHMTEVLGLADQ